jgi:hypothetical protein
MELLKEGIFVINQIKQKLAGLKAVIDLSNKQGCSVLLEKKNQWDMFSDRIEYYFAKFSKSSGLRYNINPSNEPSISDLEVFDFAMDRFVLGDLFGLLLEHIDLREQNHLTEFVVILSERELMDDAGDNGHDTEKEHWSWDYLQETFRGLYEKGFELEPQRVYGVEEGRLHVHFKMLEV